MALSSRRLQQIAGRMLADYDHRQPNAVFAEHRPGWLTLSEAYRLQRFIRDLRLARGERICGYKIGCLSPAIQRQFGLNQPVRGFLWEHEGHASGARLGVSQFVNLALEGEIALRVGRSPAGAPADPEELRRYFEDWFPVIELHQHLFAGPGPTSEELVAGNAMHAGFVLPDRVGESRPDFSDLDEATIRVTIDGVSVEQRRLNELPGGIWAGVRWLLSELAASGDLLAPGHLILAGSPGRLIPVHARNHVSASCGERRVDLVIEPGSNLRLSSHWKMHLNRRPRMNRRASGLLDNSGRSASIRGCRWSVGEGGEKNV